MSISINRNGAIFASNPNKVAYAYFNNGSTFNYPITLEFDYLEVSNRANVGIDLFTDEIHRWNFGEFRLNTSTHVKLVYDGEHITPYMDDFVVSTGIIEQSALTNFKLGFYVRNDSSFKIKNLIVYTSP